MKRLHYVILIPCPNPFPFTWEVTFNVLIVAFIERKPAFHGSLLFIWISRAAQSIHARYLKKDK